MPLKRDEPNMSDRTLIVTVEDLISRAFGPEHNNTVNFKTMQMVLNILAQQMRMLEQRVEIKISDITPHETTKYEYASAKHSPRQKPNLAKLKETKLRIGAEEKVQKFPVAEEKATKEKDKIISKEQQRLGKDKEKEVKTAQKEIERNETSVSNAPVKDDQVQKAEMAPKVETKMERESRRAQRGEERKERMKSKEDERAERAAQKEREKAERSASKERERAQREAEKQKEREERIAEKIAEKIKEKREEECLTDQQKEEKRAFKEKEREERSKSKEREKAERAALKEIEKKERTEQKERERLEKEARREMERNERDTQRKLRLERIRAMAEKPRGSIDVVTQSQFALLVDAVEELQVQVEPAKPLALPQNKQLMSELASGSATLQGTMEAMQLDARVKAAEDMIGRMTGLLTQLTAGEGLEQEFRLYTPDQTMTAKGSMSRKSVMIDPSAKQSATRSVREMASSVGVSRSSVRNAASSMSIFTAVTHNDMERALRDLREELTTAMNNMTTRPAMLADTALSTSKTVAEKLSIALGLDDRLTMQHALAQDYTEQLLGLDAGLNSQLQGFQDQMAQIRIDLRRGLEQVYNVNNNAETAAMAELSDRHRELVTALDETVHAHRSLTRMQSQLGGELHSLVECVEMMREQKADRDEVLDGLNDKADISRLAGLLTEIEFAKARADLEKRLFNCHDKFKKQENIWMAAILKRKLADGGACASCGLKALMSPVDATYGAPPRLPALRTPPAGAPTISISTEGPCLAVDMVPTAPEERHICRRWVGGSHTLISESTRRGPASSVNLQAVPTKKYVSYGIDGRLYMMEEELKPCIECNKLDDEPTEQILTQVEIDACACGDAGPALQESREEECAGYTYNINHS
ncbi:titin homolog isoform X2 [Leptidea sinapis]|uniref:titin homolog isoform X2 n=1 Tax=Leptidea sinapis TaxID=189913 RepID=UPI0021C316D1|nr:titin homolog isoform X2 [Leptidea sinapis]